MHFLLLTFHQHNTTQPECENWFDTAVLEDMAAKDGMMQCKHCSEQRLASTVCTTQRYMTTTQHTLQLLHGCGTDVSPSEYWEELWPSLNATVGQECASALLVRMGCVLDESDIQDAGERFLEANDVRCADLLDKYAKVCFLLHPFNVYTFNFTFLPIPPQTFIPTQTVMYTDYNKQSY